MESYRIDPAKPPLPTDSYRPDHPDGGSHTSNLMFESRAGRISPVTRQKAAGTGVGRRKARAHVGTGGVKAPAATDAARVIVVFGNARCARSAQFVAATGFAAHASDVNAASASRDLNFLSVICLHPLKTKIVPVGARRHKAVGRMRDYYGIRRRIRTKILRSKCLLILTRRIGETLMIGNEVTVTVLSVKGNQVRIGVNAPKDVAVHREEVYERVQREKAIVTGNVATDC